MERSGGDVIAANEKEEERVVVHNATLVFISVILRVDK